MAEPRRVTQVIKRTGAIAPFDQTKITNAIYKAAAAVGGHDRALSQRLSDEVMGMLERYGGTPSVEEIQDVVEKVLIENGHARTAKAYILYRDERARLRRAKGGQTGTHPLLGDELRMLRVLKREAKSPFIFVSERGARFSVAGLAKLIERAGIEACELADRTNRTLDDNHLASALDDHRFRAPVRRRERHKTRDLGRETESAIPRSAHEREIDRVLVGLLRGEGAGEQADTAVQVQHMLA